VSDEAVRLAGIGKLGWIKRQRAGFEDQPRQSKREMVSGECAQLDVTCFLPRPMADVKDLDLLFIFVDSIVNQQRAVQ
jgi:hypothetical protein